MALLCLCTTYIHAGCFAPRHPDRLRNRGPRFFTASSPSCGRLSVRQRNFGGVRSVGEDTAGGSVVHGFLLGALVRRGWQSACCVANIGSTVSPCQGPRLAWRAQNVLDRILCCLLLIYTSTGGCSTCTCSVLVLLT